MTIILEREELKILADALAYYLDTNEEIEFNNEEVNELYEKILELKEYMK